MSITHSLTRGWLGQNGNPVTPAAQLLTGSEELNLDFTLSANTTNQQISLAFTKTLLQSIFIYSATQNITLKTNSSSAPQETLTITAGIPAVWSVNDGFVNPFAGNVTTAYVTNATATDTAVSIRCLTNG